MDFLNTSFGLFESLIWLVVVFLSIAFHEYSHGWMASQLGDDTAERAGRLTLNPLSHLDVVGSVILPLLLLITNSPFLFGWAKPVPYNPANLRNPRWGAAAVAAAGPASNLIIALFAALGFRIFYHGFTPWSSVAGFDFSLQQFFALLAIMNIALAVFNLIPIPPLDGSKLLAAVLPRVGREIFDFLERLGPFLVLFILLIGFQFVFPILGKVVWAIFSLMAGV